MHHPWRWVRDRLPEWDVLFVALPDGLAGDTDSRTQTIRIDSGLTQAQRRCTVDHERIHARDGDIGDQPPWREAQINRESAIDLIPFHLLVDACVWSYSKDEAAEELWVDLDTLQARLDNLTDAERVVIRTAIAQRDFHEEGL